MEKAVIKQIFREIKPEFKAKLGKYTHKRVSEERNFRGLAFIKDELFYLFGMNTGFFKTQGDTYNQVGMNVLVKTNGENQEYRTKLTEFFRKNLSNWYFTEEKFTSFRGDLGVNFSRCKEISEFNSKEEIVIFLQNSISELQKIYPLIIKNEDNLFDLVLKASPPWHDTIIDICSAALDRTKFKPLKK